MKQEMDAAARLLRDRNKPRPIVTPCCRASSTLRGRPAPQYHCDDCGKVYTSLAGFVRKDGR